MIGHKLFHMRKRLKSNYVYSQSDINKVLSNVSLLQIISGYVTLRKSGQDYIGRCPFCRTLTRNDFHFRVSERLKRYKCFECGVGGSYAHSFLMRYHNLPFDKILWHLNNGGIRLISERIVAGSKRDNIGDDLPF